jgi:hypothetical protein
MEPEGSSPFSRKPPRTLFWASRIQFATSIPISIMYILMLFSHLRIGLPSGHLFSGLTKKIL